MNCYYGFETREVPEWEKEHMELSRDIAARGIVLLENRGALPLAANKRVALYGYGARRTLYCGLGSASINCRKVYTVEEGLEEAGLEIASKGYLDRYQAMIDGEEKVYYDRIRESGDGVLIRSVVNMYRDPLVPTAQPMITAEDIREAACDTAIFVISRNAGEDADRKLIEGDYLLLDSEKQNLQVLSENFKNVIVLLNVCGVMDTTYLRSMPNLGALLLIGLGGSAAGLAVADVLTGKITPEGKLAATWARKYEDYPNAQNYAAMNQDLDDEYYTEGIYVGYRYFDSMGIEPAYAFGYGLSYTEFGMKTEAIDIADEKVKLTVAVTNTGKQYAGRETVQVYVSAPEGKLAKPFQELKGYEKTKTLAPGETQKVTVEIPLQSLASYSEEDGAWILEAGMYKFRVGNSSRNAQVEAVVLAEQTIITEKCRNLFAADCELQEMNLSSADPVTENSGIPAVSLKNGLVNTKINRYQESPAAEGEKPIPDCIAENAPKITDVIAGKLSLDEFVDTLTLDEMVYLCVGNPADAGTDTTEGGEMICAGSGDVREINSEVTISIVPGSCDTTRELAEKRDIPNMVLSDGASGVRVAPEYEVDENGAILTPGILAVYGVSKIIGKDFITDREHHRVFSQYTTGLPIPTVVAQTWDKELCRVCGELEGSEMQKYGINIWLAPAMNIHRNPLCGRNFEYFSEDPVISGECAAAVINGLQKYSGTGATIKHMACNNQEDNRHASNAHMSERALREIYLKGYEIAVKKAQPVAMMTSYNLINGIHAANNYDMITSVVRDEWGFQGFVMTDWGTTSQGSKGKKKYDPSTCAGCMHAGNDLIMPGSWEDIKNLKEAVLSGEVAPSEIRTCVKRILQAVIRLRFA